MNLLKAYCHSAETIESGSAPIECHEVSFQASPTVLREIAAFLLRCADKFEENPTRGADHFHFLDEWKGKSETFTDVIVFPPALDG